MGTKMTEHTHSYKLKPEEYDINQMLSVSRAFLKAAKLCNEPPVENLGWSHPLIVPMVTNLALSCELFIKTLFEKYNSPQKGHNLYTLFECLPEEAKLDIIGSNDKEDFIYKLNQNSCLFEEWRYIYECPIHSVNISFLFDFAGRLSDHIEQFV